MKTSYIVVLSLSTLVISQTQAYEYTFINRSYNSAEVQFQLALDIIANYPVQTVKVPAATSSGVGTASITIPEWHRSGLCLNTDSFRLKFSPSTTFKKPRLIDEWNGQSLPQLLCGPRTFSLLEKGSSTATTEDTIIGSSM